MKIRVNDHITVLTGKDRGKTGIVTKFVRGKVVVEGVNKTIKHIKKQNNQPGERIEFFSPIDISNVAITDSKTGKPSRVGYKIEGNQKFRIAKKSGEKVVANLAKKAAKKASPKETKK